MRIEAPYHEGELSVQERVGELDAGKRNGAAIADSIVKGALRFIAQQPMVVLGSIDPGQDVWASILFGTPGFVTANDERTLTVDLNQTALNPHDPIWSNIDHDPRLGMLVIEVSTRRRLRINGRATRSVENQLRVDVDESYPNCPKYLQRRQLTSMANIESTESPEPRRGELLLPEHRDLMASTDTFFVASANPRGGVDASHRGGNTGFIRVLSDTTLRIPDYRGNSMYNTLGNFALHPHAGLLFLDFDHGRILQLTGRPVVHWKMDDRTNETGGTGRYWDFELDRWLESPLPAGVQCEFLDYSPHNPKPQDDHRFDNAAKGTNSLVCAICDGVENNEPGDCP